MVEKSTRVSRCGSADRLGGLPNMRRLLALVLLVSTAACTDAGRLRAAGQRRARTGSHRLRGRRLRPTRAGDTFPVKVLFLVEGGSTVPVSTVGAVITSIQDAAQRSGTNVKFALAAYHVTRPGPAGQLRGRGDDARPAPELSGVPAGGPGQHAQRAQAGQEHPLRRHADRLPRDGEPDPRT